MVEKEAMHGLFPGYIGVTFGFMGVGEWFLRGYVGLEVQGKNLRAGFLRDFLCSPA